jgi:hypothetical protein
LLLPLLLPPRPAAALFRFAPQRRVQPLQRVRPQARRVERVLLAHEHAARQRIRHAAKRGGISAVRRQRARHQQRLERRVCADDCVHFFFFFAFYIKLKKENKQKKKIGGKIKKKRK